MVVLIIVQFMNRLLLGQPIQDSFSAFASIQNDKQAYVFSNYRFNATFEDIDTWHAAL